MKLIANILKYLKDEKQELKQRWSLNKSKMMEATYHYEQFKKKDGKDKSDHFAALFVKNEKI